MGRDHWALLVALTAHAGLLVTARSLPPRSIFGDRATVAVIDVEILDEGDRTRPSPAAPEAPRPAAVSKVEEAPVARPAEARAVEPAREPTAARPELPSPSGPPSEPASAAPSEPASPSSGAEASAPAPGSPEEYGAPEERGPVMPGLGAPIWAALPGLVDTRGEAAPDRAPAADPVHRDAANAVLGDALRARDKNVGIDLPATQVVVGAVSTAVRSVSAPHNARATFEVRLGQGGKVIGTRLVSASAGNEAAWDGAARAIGGALAAQKLELGSASQSGATIIVTTTTKHVFPAGTTKPADIKPVCANQVVNDILDASSTQDGPSTGGPTVPIFTDENGRPCIPIGIGGIADAANIGAVKQLQIQTKAQVLVDGKEALPDATAINKDPYWLERGNTSPRPVMPFQMRKYRKDKEKKK